MNFLRLFRILVAILVAAIAADADAMPSTAETAAEGRVASRLDSMQYLNEVVVERRTTSRDAVIPAQSLGGKKLESLNALSVADAIRYFSGAQIKDYGGVGGIKSIDIRSMGTNHVGVFYDGLQLGNAQNGQIDLGQFSLDNVEEISLYNGHRSALLQTASDYANAGTVYIRTRRPRFTDGRNTNLLLKAKYGASDLIRLSTLWEQHFSDNVSMSLSAEALNSSGKYKFRYRRFNIDGTVAYDTTSVRNNGDVWSVRVEDNLFGHSSFSTWNIKLYTYHS